MKTQIITAVIVLATLQIVGTVYVVKHKNRPILKEVIVEKQLVKEVVNLDGYKCERKGEMSDLLQPSGYWVNITLSCWKLEIPIKEYCKTNPCESNNYRH